MEINVPAKDVIVTGNLTYNLTTSITTAVNFVKRLPSLVIPLGFGLSSIIFPLMFNFSAPIVTQLKHEINLVIMPIDPFVVGVIQKLKSPTPVQEVRRLTFNKIVASWYGPGFDGRLTASGVHFHQEEMTVASRTIRFGTHLLITNPINGNYVIARVTDRGPFVEGRDIDLSHGVAFKLGLIQRGVAPVLIAQIGEGDIRPILNHFPPQSMLKGSLHKTHSHVGHSGYHGHLLKQSASHLTSKLPVVRTYTLYQPRHPMN